jgi:hypothetical protein
MSKHYFVKRIFIMFKLGNTYTKTLIAACVLATAGLQVMAQNAPTTGAAAPQKHEQMQKRHQERMQKNMVDLKQKLALRADQESAWTQWQAETQGGMQHGAKMDHKAMEKLSTPERIDRMQAQHAERSQHMQKVAQSTKQFYAKLDSAQQKTFDEQGTRHMRGMRDHKGGHGKHHG